MCVNNLSKVALDSAAAGIEPATSSRKSNALTTAPPSSDYRTEDLKQLLRSKPGLHGCQIRRHLRFIAYIPHFLRICLVQNGFQPRFAGPLDLLSYAYENYP